MNSTQIKKPRSYILGGLSCAIFCVLLLFLLEYFLTAPNAATLIYWQMRLALPVYALFIVAILAILRGLTLFMRQRQYSDERP